MPSISALSGLSGLSSIFSGSSGGTPAELPPVEGGNTILLEDSNELGAEDGGTITTEG